MNRTENEVKKIIVPMLNRISDQLNDVENILRKNGINIPEENIALDESEKIKPPVGYIRTVDYFRNKYKLDYLLNDEPLIRNISYALQFSDFLNYLINRFSVYGPIERMLYKYAIINLFTIIESVLYGVVNKLHSYCQDNEEVCQHNQNCPYYLKKADKYSFRELLEELSKKDICPLQDSPKLLEIKELRDYIHLWDIDNIEYFEGRYSVSMYNDCISILQELKDSLMKKTENFEEKRITYKKCPKSLPF